MEFIAFLNLNVSFSKKKTFFYFEQCLIKSLVFVTIFALSFTVNAQDKAFKVEVIGKGEPVLLFPGFTCTGDVWQDLVTELSKTNESNKVR